jgi:hypothetical protein
MINYENIFKDIFLLFSIQSSFLIGRLELRFEITENLRFSGSCDVVATARLPFRFAQED